MEDWYEVNELDENEEILYSTTVKSYDEALSIYRDWEAEGGNVQLMQKDAEVDWTEMELLMCNY